MYLPWNAVEHKVPAGVSAEPAGIVTLMANGIEWALFDCGLGYNSTVPIKCPWEIHLSRLVFSGCKLDGDALRAGLDACGADQATDARSAMTGGK